jgi:hypothetical protein
MKRILGARTNLKRLSRKPAIDFAGLRVPLRSSARFFTFHAVAQGVPARVKLTTGE